MVLLPAARTGSRHSQDSSGAPRPSIEVRVDAAAGSPAKARMLWREGFTPHEIENSSINDKEVKRQEVIFEIIHTEADYVKDLRIIVDVLMGPLRKLRIVPPEQVDLIFGNIGDILELHEDINAAFMERQRMQYPVVWDISDVLLPFVSRFRLYARYICNQDNALRLVEELRRNSNSFAVFWKERQKRPECRSLPMESFLALPFQRLLKYPLLLRTLLNSTEGWSQQFANGTMVAEQVDAWINKIQDARAKLDSFACIDALSKAVDAVNWEPLVTSEHRLVHAGPVRTTNPHRAENGGALPPDRPATMWLFDDFAIIASSISGTNADGPGFLPVPNTKYSLVMGPCQIIEVLELAQCKGSPAAYLHAVPFHAPNHSQKTSIVVRFASRTDYTLWRGKLDNHVRRMLEQQPTLSADILAEAIARAKIIDSGPAPQCIGAVRSPPSTGFPSANPSAMVSSSEIPTISVRDVYVQFPTPRHKGKLRRGWDFLCSKTEDITGQGIKRQLKKYGGGGGKRRATEGAPPAKMHRRMSRHHPKQAKCSPLAGAKPTGSASSLISTPLMGPPPPFFPLQPPAPTSQPPQPPQPMQSSPVLPSPSFVHINQTAVPSAVNGGRESAAHTLSAAAPPGRLRSSVMMGTYHPRLRENRASTISMANSVTSRMEPSTESFVLRSYAGYSSRRSEDTTVEGMPMQHDMLLSSMEFGSATLACAGEPPMSSSSSFTGRTLSAAAPPRSAFGTGAGTEDDDISDSEFSTSEISAMFPEHLAERSGSTLFNPQTSPRHTISYSHLQSPMPPPPQPPRRASAVPKPLPIPPASRASRTGFSSRKPAPVFEFGSAKLTNGGGSGSQHVPSGLKTWGTSAQEVMNNMPGFQSTDYWQSLARPPQARSWQAIDADNPSSANSTESFCIVNREPQPPVHQLQRQNAGRHGRTHTFT
ncbi:RHO1 GDP-GTP exchange protein 2 [Coemansia sp. RSA 2708]|nr:RHO1 GDP-GTP exchange protein 2 [Coemansia sp. RSA 2708]